MQEGRALLGAQTVRVPISPALLKSAKPVLSVVLSSAETAYDASTTWVTVCSSVRSCSQAKLLLEAYAVSYQV